MTFNFRPYTQGTEEQNRMARERATRENLAAAPIGQRVQGELGMAIGKAYKNKFGQKSETAEQSPLSTESQRRSYMGPRDDPMVRRKSLLGQ